MWPKLRTHAVCLLLVLVCLRSVVMAEEDASDNLCAMKEAMVAMKDLLNMLTDEVRDLRKQVGLSCAPGDHASKKPDDHPSDDADDTDKSKEKDDGPSEQSAPPAPTTTAIPTTTEEYDYEEGNFTNPVDNVVSGFSDWWTGFSLFDAKTTTEAPDIPVEEDEDDYDYDTREPTDDDDYELVQPDRPRPRPRPQPPSRTTTTTERPHALPPVPTSCPEPFRLLAESCYLILDSQHTWSTWGDAYSLCERYGGEMAAPWRFESLREFLTQYYITSFWVGARRMPHTERWEWLSGRQVQQDEWRPGKPTRIANQPCVMLDSRAGYKASNYYCGEKYAFVCEARQEYH